MVLDYQRFHLEHVKSYISLSVIPIQYAVDVPTRVFDWIVLSIGGNQRLQEDNAHLRVEILLLQAQLQKLIALENENTQLRAMLQSSPRGSERLLVAQLISVDTDPFLHEIILNQGSRAGLYIGQPVLDATGVLGQVIAVGPYTSRVLLLTDTRSAIPSQDSSNGIRGIVVGTGNSNYLQLANIPATTNIKIGDTFVTSGLDGHLPFGYPVGIVKKIVHSPGEEFADITIEPCAHVNSSRLVLLVWPKGSLAQDDNNLFSGGMSSSTNSQGEVVGAH